MAFSKLNVKACRSVTVSQKVGNTAYRFTNKRTGAEGIGSQNINHYIVLHFSYCPGKAAGVTWKPMSSAHDKLLKMTSW